MASVITAAVLENPEAFANAAKTTVEAYGEQIKNAERAISVLTKARSFIASTKTDHSYIVNLSDAEFTWHCYNDLAPIKWFTQFQSHMGAYCAVEVHCLGWGAMHIYKNNENPAFTVNRNSVYLFDGKNISLFFDANRK
jgi:hypothetical protein